MNPTEEITLIFFTCTGREHLIGQTWQSFAPFLNGIAHRRVLAIDGPIGATVLELLAPQIVVQNPTRRGYIHSIINALALVETELFLWLEDDWQASGDLDIRRAIAELQTHPDWMQVRWSKTAPLKPEDVLIAPDIHLSSDGFSANPCLCRTSLLRSGFKDLLDYPKGSTLGCDGFENVLTKWAREKGHVCAVFQPGEAPDVDHLGYLESTGRQWHMTSSLEGVPTEHLYNFGDRPPVWRRIVMLLKLCRAFFVVGSKQLWNLAAYEFAFRIVTTNLSRPDRQRRANHP